MTEYNRYPNNGTVPISNSELDSGVGGIYKGSGNVSSNTTVTIDTGATLNFTITNGTNMTITDSRTSPACVGMKYTADYSGFFEARSIPDVGFVMNAISNYVTDYAPNIYRVDGTTDGNRIVTLYADSYFKIESAKTAQLYFADLEDKITFGSSDVTLKSWWSTQRRISSDTVPENANMFLVEHDFDFKLSILNLQSKLIGSYSSRSVALSVETDYVRYMSIGIFGDIMPASLPDSSVEDGRIYYSTDQNKLVFKDFGGTVRDLY